MWSIGVLSLFSTVILIWPPQVIKGLLILLPLPFGARVLLLMAVVANVIVSMTFEEWGAAKVADMIGAVVQWRRQGRRRTQKAYKIVEGGMRAGM